MKKSYVWGLVKGGGWTTMPLLDPSLVKSLEHVGR